MKKTIITIALFVPWSLIVLLGFSCNDKKLATAARDVSASVAAFQAGEIAFHDQHRIADEYHAKIQEDLKKIAIAGQHIDSVIGQPTVNQAIDDAIKQVQLMISEGLFPVGDIEAQQRLTLLAESIITAFNSLRAVIPAPSPIAGLHWASNIFDAEVLA